MLATTPPTLEHKILKKMETVCSDIAPKMPSSLNRNRDIREVLTARLVGAWSGVLRVDRQDCKCLASITTKKDDKVGRNRVARSILCYFLTLGLFGLQQLLPGEVI